MMLSAVHLPLSLPGERIQDRLNDAAVVLAQIEVIIRIKIQHQLRNAPEIVGPMINRKRKTRMPLGDRLASALQGVNLGTLDAGRTAEAGVDDRWRW